MRQVDTRSAGVSFLFPAGSRPSQEDVARLLASSVETGLAARISHHPKDQRDWLELLISGLTFDILGLSPDPGTEQPGCDHYYGFDDATLVEGWEAITMVPSGHITSGAALDPVLRSMAGFAANLVLNLPVAAVRWHSAGTIMEPRYFARVVLNWLAGGAFPALGLTALVSAPDGSIASEGLAHFTGQELQLQGLAGEPKADTVKLAIRLVDHFVRAGHLSESRTIENSDHRLVAEPSQVGRRILVWRQT